MRRAMWGVLWFAVLFAGPALAQQPRADRWQIKLEDDIYVWDVRLQRLSADTLYVTQVDSVVPVPIGRIVEMRLIRKSEMRMGAQSLAGAMSALTGGDDDVFDFTPLDFAGRLQAVQEVLRRYPPGTSSE